MSNHGQLHSRNPPNAESNAGKAQPASTLSTLKFHSLADNQHPDECSPLLGSPKGPTDGVVRIPEERQTEAGHSSACRTSEPQDEPSPPTCMSNPNITPLRTDDESNPFDSAPSEGSKSLLSSSVRWILNFRFKAWLSALVIASVIFSAIGQHVRKSSQTISNITIIPANQETHVGRVLPGNATELSLSLTAVSGLEFLKAGGKETILTLQVSSEINCSKNLSIQKNDISRWINNPHLVVFSCWRKWSRAENVTNVSIILTNKMDKPLGVLLDIDVEESSIDYIIAVFVILSLIQIILISEYFQPVEVVMISSCLATAIHYTYQTRSFSLADQFPYGRSIISGSIVDQLLLVSGVMIMVNCLIHCGFYSSITYGISKLVGYRWSRSVAVLFMLSAVLSSLVGRTITAQLFTPLAIRLSEAYELDRSNLVYYTIFFINAGNLLCAVGNDAFAPLYAYKFDDARFGTFAGVLLCSGGLAVILIALVLVICLRCKWSKLKEGTSSVYLHQANIMARWKETITPLTKADIFCRNLADNQQQEVYAQQSMSRQPNGLIVTNYFSNRFALNIEFNYRMTNWKQFIISCIVIVLALIGIPTVRWIEWDTCDVPAVTPGLISLSAAICLFIMTGSEEKTIRSLNISTLIYIALYRYTTQTLLTGPILDRISSVYYNIGVSNNNWMKTQWITFIIGVTWLSSLLTFIMGVESFSPDMMNVFSEMYSADKKGVYLTAKICQIVGSTLSGNFALYASLSNVLAKDCAMEHGIKMSPWKFMRLAIPVSIATMCGATICIMIWCNIAIFYFR